MLMSANFIGVSGIAGSGKDLFCSSVQQFYKKNRKLKRKVHILSLAKQLKDDIAPACINIFHIDPRTCSRQQKEKIRDFIVFHAEVMRQKSKGRYWIDRLEKEVSSNRRISENDIVMISDLRHDEFPKDESHWILKEKKGIIVHVKKHLLSEISETSNLSGTRFYAEAPNAKEKFNDPKMQKKANYLLDWPHLNQDDPNNLQEYVKNFCDWYENKLK